MSYKQLFTEWAQITSFREPGPMPLKDQRLRQWCRQRDGRDRCLLIGWNFKKFLIIRVSLCFWEKSAFFGEVPLSDSSPYATGRMLLWLFLMLRVNVCVAERIFELWNNLFIDMKCYELRFWIWKISTSREIGKCHQKLLLLQKIRTLITRQTFPLVLRIF